MESAALDHTGSGEEGDAHQSQSASFPAGQTPGFSTGGPQEERLSHKSWVSPVNPVRCLIQRFAPEVYPHISSCEDKPLEQSGRSDTNGFMRAK